MFQKCKLTDNPVLQAVCGLRRPLLIILFLCLAVFSVSARQPRKVHTTTISVPPLAAVDVRDPDKFLNDLKLSPYWKVEKSREGIFCAYARGFSSRFEISDQKNPMFLFEAFGGRGTPENAAPEGRPINNYYIPGNHDFTVFSATILFGGPPDPTETVYENGPETTLTVYEAFDNTMGPNSFSQLAVCLSKEHDIYLVLYEQGADPDRNITAAKLPAVMEHLSTLLALPRRYYVKEYYRRFFAALFPGSERAMVIRREPGIQDRDNFYGYFQAQPGVSYEGINIKISHQEYCGGECTRDYNRLDKAEYLGRPYYDHDLLFFRIEDNAVYLKAGYDERYGTFSGKDSFLGLLEIINDQHVVLYSAELPFKGWER